MTPGLVAHLAIGARLYCDGGSALRHGQPQLLSGEDEKLWIATLLLLVRRCWLSIERGLLA